MTSTTTTEVGPESGLKSLSTLLIVLSVLLGIAGIIAGIALASHIVTVETGSGYFRDSEKVHPFTGVGAGVAIGSVVQALVLGSLGAIANAVDKLVQRTESADPAA